MSQSIATAINALCIGARPQPLEERTWGTLRRQASCRARRPRVQKGVLCRHAHAHVGYEAQRRWLTSLDAPRYLSAAEQGFYVSVHFHCSHHGLRSSIPGYSMCLVKAWLSPMGAETKAPACSKTVPLVLHQGVCLDPGSTFTRKEGQRKAGLCTLRLDNRRSSPSLVCYPFWLSVTAHNAMATTAHNRTAAVPEQ